VPECRWLSTETYQGEMYPVIYATPSIQVSLASGGVGIAFVPGGSVGAGRFVVRVGVLLRR
jgi:hypothetical protein